MMRKTRWMAGALLASCLSLTMLPGLAAADAVKSDMKVLADGKEAAFAAGSVLISSSLYAAYAPVAAQLGATAKWDEAAGLLTVTRESNVLELALNAATYKVNGLEQTTATPLQKVGGDVLVPVRLLFEVFGHTIGYDAASRTIRLSSGESGPSLRVFGVAPGGYTTGSELRLSVFAFHHILTNFDTAKDAKAGEGHLQIWLDNESLDADSAIRWYRSEPLVLTNVKPGPHVLTIQLAGNDGKPLVPEVRQSIRFTAVDVSILKDLDPAKATGMRIEGVIADAERRVYTVEMDLKKLYRIAANTGAQEALTELSRPATGMAFDAASNLYIASGGQEGVIFKVKAADLTGEPFDPALVETYASGVQGANGLTFDAKGNLYVSGGANGNIYKVAPDGNVTTYASGLRAERQEQQITANGVAFGPDGKLYVANTSSGEVHRFAVQADGALGASELVAKSALLYGADGLTFGPDGAVYIAANERNAIVRVGTDGQVSEVAHNGNAGPLEFPASLHFVGTTLYISNFDQPRGDNKPNEPGIGASIAKIEFGDAAKP